MGQDSEERLSRVTLALLVNSIIGRRGNIGYRFLPVVEALAPIVRRLDVCCRDTPPLHGARVHPMGPLGHIPRVLNAIRIYFHRGFSHRHVDVWLFAAFCRLTLPRRAPAPALAHVVEFSPGLLRDLKVRGYRTVLEVPIAPLSYMKKLQERLPGAMPEPLDRAMMEVEVAAIRTADVLVCPSEFVADELAALGVERSRIHVTPFATDVDEWRRDSGPQPSKTGIDFCFAGNVGYRKGCGFLLEAWRRGPFAEDRLHLCGRVYPEGRRMMAACGAANIVTPGFVDTAEYFKTCDIYVLPSLMEGSAKSIYEAMNREMPVITTREAGSIVRDGVDGFIVPAGDARALVDRMTWLKANPESARRMGRAAKQHVSAFTQAAYVDRLKHVYALALG